MRLITKVDIDGNLAGTVIDIEETAGKQLLSLGLAVPLSEGDDDSDAVSVTKSVTEIKDAHVDHGPEDDHMPENRNSNDFPRHSGGGWYELSNGESVRGEEEAIDAENNLERNDS